MNASHRKRAACFPHRVLSPLLLLFLILSPVFAAEDTAQREALAALWKKAGSETDPAAFRDDCHRFLTAAAIYLKNHPDDPGIWTLRTRAAVECGRVTEADNSAAQMRRLGLDKIFEPVYWDTLHRATKLLATSPPPDKTSWAYPDTLPADDPGWSQLNASAHLPFTLLDQRMRKLYSDWDIPAAEALLRDTKKFNLDNPGYLRGWQMQAQLALSLNSQIEGSIATRKLTELGLTTGPLVELLQKHNWLAIPTK